MYNGLRVLAVAPAFNEVGKIEHVIARVPRDIADDVLIVDDGSCDGTPDIARSCGARVVSHDRTRGVGAAVRTALDCAVAEDFDAVVFLAGNNKDFPEHLPTLLAALQRQSADIVQGSRYLDPSRDFGPMPAYRRLATRLHPVLFRMASGHRMTDTTNGFRAVRVSSYALLAADLAAPRYDRYGFEPALLFRALAHGMVVVEVPARKVYPERHLGQTKMRPVRDWWSILWPILEGAALRLMGRSAAAGRRRSRAGSS